MCAPNSFSLADLNAIALLKKRHHWWRRAVELPHSTYVHMTRAQTRYIFYLYGKSINSPTTTTRATWHGTFQMRVYYHNIHICACIYMYTRNEHMVYEMNKLIRKIYLNYLVAFIYGQLIELSLLFTYYVIIFFLVSIYFY